MDDRGRSAALRPLFTAAQAERLECEQGPERRHPVGRLLFPQERDEQMVANTEYAVREVGLNDNVHSE